MIIEVTGPKGGRVDTHLEWRVHHAISSFAKTLKIDRFKLNILVRIHNKAIIDECVEGWCEIIDSRSFEIDVALYSNWMGVLAHEMVHVKQYVRKELDYRMNTWKSKPVDPDEIEYYDRPWEIEAFKLQKILLDKYEERRV